MAFTDILSREVSKVPVMEGVGQSDNVSFHLILTEALRIEFTNSFLVEISVINHRDSFKFQETCPFFCFIP